MKQVLSNPASPTEPNFRSRQASHPRSMSDAASKPVDFGPRASFNRLGDPIADYQFSGIITSHAGPALTKRVTQGGKRAPTSSMMAEVMRGNDVNALSLPGERGRHHSIAGPSTRLSNKSKSPHNKPGLRAKSPQNKLLTGRHLSPAGRAVLTEGQGVDFQNAYRRLSDANLAFSGGSLSELSRRKISDDPAYGRLEKDYLSPDGDLLLDDSSDDHGDSSSEDEDSRGRKAARTFDSHGEKNSSAGSKSPETTRKSLSLLAAAEEERMLVPAGRSSRMAPD